ncbi:MAG TPA: hypothetical protein VMH27_22570 [Puia sp.]|nr:hypothetical protein [Puia sp.]
MSDHQKENELRIAAYLQNRLSPEEREAFKRSLSEDDELRLLYVDALMNRAGTGQSSGGSGGAVTEDERSGMAADGPAETTGQPEHGGSEADHGSAGSDRDGEVTGSVDAAVGMGELEEVVREAGPEEETGEGIEPLGGWQTVGEQGAREAWEAGWPGGKKKARVGFLGSGWMVGVTALVLIIAAVVIYVLSRHHEFWERTVSAISADSSDGNKRNKIDASAMDTTNNKQTAATDGKRDTAAKEGGTVGAGERGGAGGPLADSVYATLYKPYTRGDDPVEVRASYQDYRTGNYAAVLAADSLVGGAAAKNYPLRNYMRLYKGLAYMATGDARSADVELTAVVVRTKPGEELYDAARWYLALNWLKRNDVDGAEAKSKALNLARDIARGYSRYRESARRMVRVLAP